MPLSGAFFQPYGDLLAGLLAYAAAQDGFHWQLVSAVEMGVGQARNRLPKVVERTVPFGMLTQSLVVIWYTTAGHHPPTTLRFVVRPSRGTRPGPNHPSRT